MNTTAHQAGLLFLSPQANLEILTLEGHEALNQLFHFTLRLVQKTPYGARDALNPLKLLGTPCQLSLQGAQGQRRICGIVRRFAFVSASTDQLEYEAELVPTWFKLTLNQAHRIFQQKSTPEIIGELFAAHGLADQYRLQLSGTYPPRDYCVQYQESDWNFINRLLEEEGIFYTFQHAETDLLVLGDQCAAYSETGSERFLAEASQHALYEESLRHFSLGARMLPSAVTTRDYRFKSPGVRLESSHVGNKGTGGGEVYHHPGEYVTQDLGQRLTRVRLEAVQREQQHFQAAGNTRRLECGGVFTLQGHPVAAHNRRWVVTQLHHRGAQTQTLEQANVGASDGTDGRTRQQQLDYRVQAQGLPADLLFRPSRQTPVPELVGLQSAVITGPAGEEVYTDQWGRIKLQFQWDRTGTLDEHSSCWVRVDQSWAGQGFGKLFHPRIGQEVWVHFLEGDADRPVIVGRVHNDFQAVPYKLPEKRTLSTLKSQTVGGQGYNEWRFEDQKGKEEIFLHGQKDWRIRVEHDKGERIGLNKNLKVGRHHTIQIGHNKTETVLENDTSQIQKDRQQRIGMNEHRIIGILRDQKIGGDDGLSIGANHQLSVGHDYYIRVGDAQEESVQEHYHLEAQKCVHYASLSDHLGIEAKTALQFKSGGTSMRLQADGTITLEGSVRIGMRADTQMNLKGGLLKLN